MRPVVLVLFVVLGLSRSCLGQWDGVVALAARLQADADVIVVVDDAASVRETPAGRAAVLMLRESGLASGTLSAWEDLASRLRLDEDAAFDRLLGRRVAFVGESKGDGRWSWVLVSEVDNKTRMLLRNRMKPVPRWRIDDRPIYALENGRFMLASVGAQTLEGAGSFVLLAPRSDEKLFGSVLLRLTGREPRARAPGDAAAESISRLAPGLSLVIWRSGDEPDGAVWDESGFVSASIDVDGDTLRASMRSSPGVLWGPEDCCDGYAMWPGEQAERLGGDALFVDIGLVGGAEDPIVGWLRDAALAGSLGAAIDELAPYLGQRAALVVRKQAAGKGPASLAFEVAAEVSDLSRAARAGDRALAGAVARFTAPGEPEAEPAEIMVEFPGAMRTASLGRFGNGLFGPAPTAAWTYQADPLGETLESMGDPQGWLALRVGESGSNLKGVRVMRDLLGREFDAESDPRISLGWVRPAALLDVLGSNGVLLPPPLDLAERVERVEWSAGSRGTRWSVASRFGSVRRAFSADDGPARARRCRAGRSARGRGRPRTRHGRCRCRTTRPATAAWCWR